MSDSFEDLAGAKGAAPMPRVDAIWRSTLYQKNLTRLVELERDRIYCKHGLVHLLDVARIMWMRNLEEGCGLAQDVVYAAALLHDIGKAEQYERGIPHEAAGERLARAVLEGLPESVSFAPYEIDAICTAIAGHRRLRAGAGVLERLLFEADKASRACFACPAAASCNWPDSKKNLNVCV